MTKDDKAALLIIDVQKGFDDPRWGNRNNPQAEANIARMLERWRSRSWPVIHVQHLSQEPGSPLRADQPGSEFKSETAPIGGEEIVAKCVNSAFIGTELQRILERRGLSRLVIVGLTTDHCVSTTARMAGNFGFGVRLVSDATATFDRTGPDGQRYDAEQIHKVSLASLHGEFATVVTTREILGLVDGPLEDDGD